MSAYSVARSIAISALPEKVFAGVRDLSRWPEWSPWTIIDRECSLDFDEKGDGYSWSGEFMGEGSMTITGETAPHRIDCHLSFRKPFRSEATSTFEFNRRDDGTEVLWTLEGKLPFYLFFLKKPMLGVFGMDRERGLMMLKDWIETGSVPSQLSFGQAQLEAATLAGIRTSCPIAEIGFSMKRDLEKLHDQLSVDGMSPLGPPLSLYHQWLVGEGRCEYTIGVPITPQSQAPEALTIVQLPSHSAFTVTHTGPYRHLGNAWSAGFARQRARKFSPSRSIDPFEVYANDPEVTPENDLVTVVHFPLKERGD